MRPILLAALAAASLAACAPAPEPKAMTLCEAVARGAETAGQRIRMTAVFRGDPRVYGVLEGKACPQRKLAFTGWIAVRDSEVAQDWLDAVEDARVVSSADELSSDFEIEATGVYVPQRTGDQPGRFQIIELHDFRRMAMTPGDRAVYRQLEQPEAAAPTDGVAIPAPK